ncbi:MAG: AMP-binding protein [Flavobacteriales bacterium]
MNEKPARKGTVRLGTQSWPATAIGAAEFRRTQAKREAWLSDVADVWMGWCEGTEPGMAVQTSGTTGSPKTVEHSRSAVLASVQDTIKHWHLEPGTHAVLALPTSFVAGQAMVVRAIEGAWDLELVAPSSRPCWQGCTDFVALTPHQAQGWIEHGAGSVRTLLLGGGPVSAPLLENLLRSGRVDEVWESYGLSEALTHVATRKLASTLDLAAPFHPLPSVTIGTDETGCAVIDAPSRELHQFVTRDCIEELPEGGFLWLGRADDVINTGGVLVHPSEVERALESFMPAWVSDWAAFGRPDEILGEAVVLRLAGTPPNDTDPVALLEDWRESLKSLLGPAKTPRSLEWGELPRTERGKLNRRLLQ